MKGCLLILLLVVTNSFAQNWTLEQCIDTALVKNYSIHSSEIKTSISEVNLRSSKYNVLPSFSGGATHGYNWGQTIDPFTNEFASNRVQYNNLYVNSSLVLFSGLQNYYGVKMKEIDHASIQLNRRIEERNLKMEVVAAYMQTLLNNELLEVATEHLIFTSIQKENIKMLIAAENKPKSSLLEIQAQEATDKYIILKAQNELNYSLLLLQQLLNLSYSPTFNIVKTDTLFEAGLNPVKIDYLKLSELKIVELDIEKKLLEIKTIKGGFFPSLNLNGSFGSGYSENRKFLTPNGELLPTPFDEQLKENFYQSASLTLSIPIYNKNTTRFRIQKSELELRQLKLDEEQEKLKIQNKLQQLRMDVSNAEALYESALIVFQAAKLNFENSQVQYESLIISYTQLLEVKDRLFKTQSELVQAKYQKDFKKIAIDLYLQ